MTTKEDIRKWLLRAKENNATHVIIVCDTFDYENYPVEVPPDEDVREKYESLNGKDMQRVMEVYNLSMDLEEQLEAERVLNF